MKLVLTHEEQNVLRELLEWEQKQIIQQLDHTDGREYKAILMNRVRGVESVLDKLGIRAVASS